MKLDWSRFDAARARARAALDRLPGKAGELARKANEALGRPLADEAELADRRAFETRGEAGAAGAAKDAKKDVAPVIVYHMDKTRRDALKLVEILEGAGIPHQVSNIQEDPAAQMAVRRDSKGFRLPVVFIAGEPIGGRAELVNLQATGELKKKVFGA
jgi:glutaredoxin-related protein